MVKHTNLAGQRFGRWLVESYSECSYWWCVCDCGTRKEVRASGLLAGRSNSCGCLKLEKWEAQITKHGYAHSLTYQAWRDMRGRCNNPNFKSYPNYGGRGITVCPEWDASFEAFLADMGDCPAGLTLERRDNEFGYFKQNCFWASMATQQRNKRNNIRIMYEGVEYVRTDLAKKFNLEPNTLKWRLAHGWSLERALTEKTDA